MARGRSTYASRQRAANVSKHLVDEMPTPTLADLGATVYRQEWWVATENVMISLMVLALDAEHAETLGGLQLNADKVGLAQLDRNEAFLNASIDVKARILREEAPAVRAHRQALFKARNG